MKTNILTTIVRGEAKIADNMQSMWSYAQEVEEDYFVSFVYVRIIEITADRLYTKFLSANSKATYIPYFTVDKMIITHQGAVWPLVRLDKDAAVMKTFSNTQLDDKSLYIFSEEAIFLINQSADEFVKNDQEAALSHENSFYRHA